MRTFKQLDFWMQLVLISVSVPFAIACYPGELTLLPYFIVGGWQVLSVMIHICFNEHYRLIRERLYYQRALLAIVVLFFLCLPVLIFYLYALLFFSPAFAVWYLSICHRENRILEHKAFMQLK